MKQLFTAHPRGVGESYWQHMASAFSFGLRMCIAGLACMVHALLPFLFTATARNTINKLHEQMITHRVRSPQCSPDSFPKVEDPLLISREGSGQLAGAQESRFRL